MRRLKLNEINTYLHCSIVGLSLTVDEARELCSKLNNVNTSSRSDYEIHSLLIEQIRSSQKFSNSVTAKLDGKYRRELFETSELTEYSQLLDYWEKAREIGNMSGAYWAILSHQNSDDSLKKVVFGEQHMVSHQRTNSLNSGNKKNNKIKSDNKRLKKQCNTDKVKLAALKSENNRLKNSVKQLNEDINSVEAKLQRSTQETMEIKSSKGVDNSKISSLQSRNSTLENKIILLKEEAEALREYNLLLIKENDELKRTTCCAKKEGLPCMLSDLGGKTVVLVGGRQSMIPHCKHIVNEMNGKFQCHDGGIEQSSLSLRNIAVNADIVVCALDCVSHDATRCVKKMCNGIDQKIIMLKKSGISTFTNELRKAI